MIFCHKYLFPYLYLFKRLNFDSMQKKHFILLILLLMTGVTVAQQPYSPTVGNLEKREHFRDMKFGVFIHWGLYSMPADGEWIMNNKNIHHAEYARLAKGFYPGAFNAEQWVADVKAAGAKYICITSRHHDGFSMFATKQSSFNIVDATPFGRDIVAELAVACHKEGIKLHFYYSLLDWSHTDYFPLGRTGKGVGRTKQGEWERYHRFMLAQLTELLTNYGEIGAIWFDGMWDQPADFDWRMREIYDHIHSLQPACLIINNHHLAPLEGEDGQTFEKDLPGQNSSGYSGTATVGTLPLETCETMNRTWGYSLTDNHYKSTEELIRYLVRAAGSNANLLMNVGPRPDGTFPESALERYHAMGDWLKIFGESIYGTRGGLIAPRHWGVTTQKGKRLFVHILNLQEEMLFLPLEEKKIRAVKWFAGGEELPFTPVPGGILLQTGLLREAVDHVVEIQLR